MILIHKNYIMTEEIINLYLKGEDFSAIRKKLCVTGDEIRKALQLKNIPLRKSSKKICELHKDEILDLYINKDLPVTEVSRQLKINLKTLHSYLKDNNLKRGYWSRKYHCNDNYFEEINTPEKAYWLGALYADGNIHKHKSQSGTIRFSTKDKEWAEKFLECIEYEGSVLREYHKKFEKEIFKARVTSDKMYYDLIKHGCVPSKSKILKMPDLHNDLIPHFVRGYFDGDGTVGIYKYLTGKSTITLRSGICSGSEEFLTNILKYIPVKSKIIKKNSNKALWCFQFSVNDSLSFCKWMYKDASIYLNRKYKIFEDFIKQRRSQTIMDWLNESNG